MTLRYVAKLKINTHKSGLRIHSNTGEKLSSLLFLLLIRVDASAGFIQGGKGREGA